jgi:glutaredoxin
MLGSFSANKYPQYKEVITNDKINYFVGSVKTIFEKIQRLIDKYDIKIMVAHNGDFDKSALSRLGNDFNIESPFDNLDLLDTMEISTIITNTKKYCDYCKANKDIIDKTKKESAFMTNSGRVRLTAQAIYSYIINNPQYQESHTALNDIDDEIRIYQESCNLLGNKLVKLNISPNWQEYEN